MAKNIKISLTLNGRKNTYFRRFDYNNQPIFTTNANSAHPLKKNDIKPLVISLIKTYGKNSIKDVKVILENGIEKELKLK